MLLFALLLTAATPGVHTGAHGAPSAVMNNGLSAGFHGRVVRVDDSAAVTGADVWLVSSGQHALTDSAGKFAFSDLTAAPQIVEIRRLGFDVLRDTLTPVAGEDIYRRYVLTSHAQRLDTVRTAAGHQRYLSARLRAFEARSLSGEGGYFVTDSVLRANESSTLLNIVTSRIPGVTRASGALVSARKQCRGVAFRSCPKQDCYVSIYIDGVLQYQAQMAERNVAPPDLGRMGVENFTGMEFYSGGANAPAGMHSNDDGCGSLWLWTREK